MKMILLERVEGWVVSATSSPSRTATPCNYLLPRHKALRANAASMKVFEAQRALIEARNARAREAAGEAARAWTARPMS